MKTGALHSINNDLSIPVERYINFEQQYLLLRKKEERIYTDNELINLPHINKAHPHYKEWLLRKHTADKLISALKNQKRFLEILEVGCGNGWLTNRLSRQVNSKVTGLDINSTELEQAARVFKDNTACTFVYGDIRSGLLNHKKFDVIIFAASIQYFSSLKEILGASQKFLKEGGAIYITDTHFYTETTIEEARQKSKSYFTSLGYSGMSAMYFHHSLRELNNFHPVILYDPTSFKNRFVRSRSLFYRISITKDVSI